MSSMNPAVAVAQQMLLGGAVKQNHALEHATIVMLEKKLDVRLSGVSSAVGFFIFGEVPTEEIMPVAEEALNVLRTTNPAVAGVLTGLSSLAVARLRRPYGSANNVITASTAALVLARPLGLTVQRYITTQTPNASMRVVKVSPMTVLGSPAHFVHTDNPDAAGLFS